MTSGDSQFVAETPIEVTPSAVRVGSSDVSLNGHNRLRGVRTDYDRWPLLNRLVRSFAVSRYREMAPEAERLADQRMRSRVATTVERTVDEQLHASADRLRQAIVGPLGRLKLDPQVMEMRTTETRLLARYRLASDWQLAAFTPRPRAPGTSLMSLQVHESAINNTLEQLVPSGEAEPVDQMVLAALDVFGRSAEQLPDDLPGDVTVQFTKNRPITVEISDQRIWITMRIIRLNRGSGLRLRGLIVRAAYRPELDGLNVALGRDGHLRISGPGISMRERLAARAIFNKVLSPTRKLILTPPEWTERDTLRDLVISQLELRDGWLGLAVSERAAPRIAIHARYTDEGLK
jgi:hypothetical protein